MNSDVFSFRSAYLISLVFSLATPVFAGRGAVAPDGQVFIPPTVGPVFVPPPEETGTVDSIVESLEAATEFCGQLANRQYTVDCIAERLAEVARQMPNTGEYAEAKAAILEASQKMHALAVANQSSAVPRARAARAGSNPMRTTRPLTPVSVDRMEQVEAEATKILAEVETVLLRSAESSESRQIAYTRIAEAVGSNKVLLRS